MNVIPIVVDHRITFAKSLYENSSSRINNPRCNGNFFSFLASDWTTQLSDLLNEMA